jgi:hypothetical protein
MRQLVDSDLDRFASVTVTLRYAQHPGPEDRHEHRRVRDPQPALFSRHGNAWNRNTFKKQVWWPAVGRIGLDDTDRDNGSHALRALLRGQPGHRRDLDDGDRALPGSRGPRFHSARLRALPHQSAQSSELRSARMARARVALAEAAPAQARTWPLADLRRFDSTQHMHSSSERCSEISQSVEW